MSVDSTDLPSAAESRIVYLLDLLVDFWELPVPVWSAAKCTSLKSLLALTTYRYFVSELAGEMCVWNFQPICTQLVPATVYIGPLWRQALTNISPVNGQGSVLLAEWQSGGGGGTYLLYVRCSNLPPIASRVKLTENLLFFLFLTRVRKIFIFSSSSQLEIVNELRKKKIGGKNNVVTWGKT